MRAATDRHDRTVIRDDEIRVQKRLKQSKVAASPDGAANSRPGMFINMNDLGSFVPHPTAVVVQQRKDNTGHAALLSSRLSMLRGGFHEKFPSPLREPRRPQLMKRSRSTHKQTKSERHGALAATSGAGLSGINPSLLSVI